MLDLTLEEFCKKVKEKQQGLYLKADDLFEGFPSLQRDVSKKYFLVSEEEHSYGVFWGTHSTITSLHCDDKDNCLGLLQGTKLVILIHPDEACKLEQKDREAISKVTSVADIHDLACLQNDNTFVHLLQEGTSFLRSTFRGTALHSEELEPLYCQ